MPQRENLASRLGFILISAGCAIGLGNVWRFPYITGLYGGGLFVLIYLCFLVAMGLPIMSAEFSVGRASKRSVARSFQELEPPGTKWHYFSWFAMAGNYLLMMFYTTVSGWMLNYLFRMIRGEFTGVTPDAVGQSFGSMLADPAQNIIWMIVICLLGFGVCALGLQNGVEKITKAMMTSLLVIMLVLVARAVTLPNAAEGLRFYLMPNAAAFREHGFWTVVYAAMGQAFFTLSVGMGSMAIFGSYIGRERRLLGESRNIVILDTLVATLSGLIIFPACYAFGIKPNEGPGLIFVTLPNVFNAMPGGYIWGIFFFIFMAFAALSTVIAVFENISAFAMDLTGCSRHKAIAVNLFVIILLSLPCALGFNLWSGFHPLGGGTGIIDLEDFLVSKNILPLGSCIYLLFCMVKRGWGYKNFLEEVNAGKGMRFPGKLRFYFTYIVPAIIILVFIMGYVEQFSAA